MSWKDKTCKECSFGDNQVCRLNPPSVVVFGSPDSYSNSQRAVTIYPEIQNDHGFYKDACSKYQGKTDSI